MYCEGIIRKPVLKAVDICDASTAFTFKKSAEKIGNNLHFS